MNNAVFGKAMENIRNHTDIKLVTSDKRRSILVSEPNYHSNKCISKDLMIIVMPRLCYMDADCFVILILKLKIY